MGGYAGYWVSDTGQVKSLRRGPERVLRQNTHRRGYKAVSLSGSTGKRTFKVHRLVAEAFLHNPDGKSDVAHYDGNPANNHVCNLRWATPTENHSDKIRHMTTGRGDENPNSKLSWEQVAQIRSRYVPGVVRQVDLATEFGVSQRLVSLIVRGENWKGW